MSPEERIAQLQKAVLNQCGDNLCHLSDAEIADMKMNPGRIPPWPEFSQSCQRFHAMIAQNVGELEGCMTIAQLEAQVERLRMALNGFNGRALEVDALRRENDAQVQAVGVVANDPAHAVLIHGKIAGPLRMLVSKYELMLLALENRVCGLEGIVRANKEALNHWRSESDRDAGVISRLEKALQVAAASLEAERGDNRRLETRIAEFEKARVLDAKARGEAWRRVNAAESQVAELTAVLKGRA